MSGQETKGKICIVLFQFQLCFHFMIVFIIPTLYPCSTNPLKSFLSVSLSFGPLVLRSIFLSVFLSICLYVHLAVWLSGHQFICSSFCLSHNPSVSSSLKSSLYFCSCLVFISSLFQCFGVPILLHI